MREEIKVGDMVEITEVRDGYGFFKKGDKARVLRVVKNYGLACDFNQLGQDVFGSGLWTVGYPCGESKWRKLEIKKGIKIKVEKYVDSAGNRMVKILDIDALPWDKLPQEYKDGECVYLCPEGSLLFREEVMHTEWHVTYELLRRNKVIPNEGFAQHMEIIKRCGERLAEINKKNRTKKKEKQVPPQKKREWSGEKEYVI